MLNTFIAIAIAADADLKQWFDSVKHSNVKAKEKYRHLTDDEKLKKRKFKTDDKISYFGQRRYLCSMKKLQNRKSTRFSGLVLFLPIYNSFLTDL